ncbi:MAG: hypothetical protein RLZZ436_3171 [Planctomycetota bacterium]
MPPVAFRHPGATPLPPPERAGGSPRLRFRHPGAPLCPPRQQHLARAVYPRAPAQWHWLSDVSPAWEDSLSVETPRPYHARRAVDVNRPVRYWCAPAAALPARLRTVTGGLTSPARLSTFLRRLRESQCHWAAARRLMRSRPPTQRVLTSHFSLLTSHFSLLTSVSSQLPVLSSLTRGSLPAGSRPAAHAFPPCGSCVPALRLLRLSSRLPPLRAALPYLPLRISQNITPAARPGDGGG